MRSLHIVSSIRMSAGGPTQSVTKLCESLNQLGGYAEIATLTFQDDLEWQGLTRIHKFRSGWPGKLHRSSALRKFIAQDLHRFDLIHVHGLWEWPGLYARLEAVRQGKPLVISPRGMIEPWSLRQNAWAKQLALAVWEKRNLESAAMFHATSKQEAESLREQGRRQPIAIIPNGIEAPPPLPKAKTGTRTLAFLSRLHPKKGVRELLEAWRMLAARHPDWNLIIAGPDEGGYGREMIRYAAQSGLDHPRVQFPGSLHGLEKWALLAKADLFVLPSHSENFGNVVLEALSQETPVLTTQATPWAELPLQECGWWVPLESLERQLNEVLSLDRDQLHRMGMKGRAWALNQFGWPDIGVRMMSAYESLMDLRAKPLNVEVLP